MESFLAIAITDRVPRDAVGDPDGKAPEFVQ